MGVTNVPVVVALLLAALSRVPPDRAVGSDAPEPADGPADRLPAFLGNCALTDDVQALLPAAAVEGGGVERALTEYRTRRPELYATTPPPADLPRAPAEFEPAEALYLTYHPWDVYAGMYGDLLEAAVPQGPVRVLCRAEDRPALEALLAERAISPGHVEVLAGVPHESVWIRDYGPMPIETSDGLASVDASYFSNCPHDDAVPARLAAAGRFGRAYRHGLRLEGGNLLSNGRGLCLTTVGLLSANGLDEAAAAEVLRRYHGCTRTLFLLPLAGDVVDHVDMFAVFASPTTLLLGDYEVEQDLLNRVILDQNAATIAEATAGGPDPVRIVRVPMPDHVAPVEGAPAVVVRSYLNLTIFNGAVLVPVFDSDPAVEAAALAEITLAFPGREVVPIPADAAADEGGGVHCLTRTVPRVRDRESRGRGHGSGRPVATAR